MSSRLQNLQRKSQTALPGALGLAIERYRALSLIRPNSIFVFKLPQDDREAWLVEDGRPLFMNADRSAYNVLGGAREHRRVPIEGRSFDCIQITEGAVEVVAERAGKVHVLMHPYSGEIALSANGSFGSYP